MKGSVHEDHVYSSLCLGTDARKDNDNMDAKNITYINGCCHSMDCKMGHLILDYW